MKKVVAFFILYIVSFVWSELELSAQDLNLKETNLNEIRIKEWIDNTHVIQSGNTNEGIRDSLENLLNRFYIDQFRHSQDPRAPYFMFMSKNGNLAMGVGGQIRIRGYFDWNGSIPSPEFVPYLIPIPKNPAQMKDLAASASGTGLFFTILGNNKVLGDFIGYFQADFNGYNHRGFRIKKAYLTFRDWTAGYAVSTFEDTKAEPETVDGAGPNGINSRKNVLIRYLHTFKNRWSIAASIEFPRESINVDDTTTQLCNPYIPDIAAFLQYQWSGGNSHVRLSGLLRTLTYRNLIFSKNFNVLGWGLQLSAVISATPKLNIFGILSTGRGHASYTTDLGNGDFDLIPVTDQKGKLYAPMAAGFVLGAQYFIKENIYANIALSEQTYYPKVNPRDSQYRYGFYGVANFMWDVTPRFSVGLEYLHGRRKNFNGMKGDADRIMAQMMLSF